MNIERILNDYPHIGEIIQDLQKQLNNAVSMQQETRDTLKAAEMTGMPRGTNVSDLTGQAVERTLDKWESRIIYLSDQINYYIDLQKLVDDAVKCLTVDEFRVIDLRYFKGYKMRQVGYKMHFEKTRCYEIHNKAIEKIEIQLSCQTA